MKKEKKAPARKDTKPKTVVNELPSERRAKGVTLPSGNPLIVFLKNSAEPLPTNMQPLLARIASKGKDGVRLESLLPDHAGQAKYQRWLLRTLVKMELVKAVGEAPAKKEEKQ